MGSIKIIPSGERNREAVTRLVERGFMTPETYAAMPEGERSAEVFVHHPGAPATPQLVELSLAPDIEVQPHAHGADEIIFILEGSISFGARECPAGSSVLIEKDTLYTFRVGPQGVTFLNFRPTGDFNHYSKEEFLARRAAAS
jgi:hypothetical protein